MVKLQYPHESFDLEYPQSVLPSNYNFELPKTL